MMETAHPSPAVISAVGGGGKTSCLKALAACFRQQGRSVFLTTTTHMAIEPGQVSDLTLAQMKQRLSDQGFLFAGRNTGDRLGPLSREELTQLCSLADITLIEADGSKGLPVKFPAEWEPVVPDHTDLVLILAGLSCLGKPLEQVCHRWELVCRHFKWEKEKLITPEMLREILSVGYLTPLLREDRRCLLLLNQADLLSPSQLQAAAQAFQGLPCRIVSIKNGLDPELLSLLLL